MPANCNSQINLKNIRIEDPIDENLAVYLYYDKPNDALRISHINPDITAVPNFSKFDFTDSIKEYFYSDLTITLKIEFDGKIGSSTTISSQNGTISPILPSAFGENYIVFTYYNSSLTDNITLNTYNSTNGKFKTTVQPIILKTTNTIPNNIASNVNTQDYQYNNVSVSFNKSVKSIGSISSLNAPSQTITYSISGGLVSINYKTPANASDTLTFNNIVDTSDFPNPDPVQLVLTDRFLPGPAFSGLVLPALNTISQNWTYTNIECDFSKNIIQNPTTPISITASTGNNPTNVRVINGNILFDWTTSNVSSTVLTFNNLYASDFTFDSGTLETINYSLRSQPISASWVVQPVLKNTTYTNIEVSFNKRISSCDVVSDGTITNKFINVRGNLQFDIITGPTNSTYTFNNIISEDFGRNTGLTLTTGPAVSSYMSATNILNDNKVLIQGATTQLFTVTFNKSITNNPTITLNSGTGVYSSGSGDTRIYSLSNITSSTNLMTFGNIQGLDSSSSSGLTIVLDPKTALTFDYIADVQFPDVARGVNYDVGTEYDLYAKFNNPPDLNVNSSGVGVSCPNATVGAITSVDGNNKYKFKLTPNNSGTNQISISNAKDINNFIYSLFTSGNLTFNAVIPVIGGLWDPSIASTLTLSSNNITEFKSSNSTNKYIDYKNHYTTNAVTNTDNVKYVVSSPSYLSFEHLTSSTHAGFYYKKNPSASYTEYTFTMVFQEPSILVAETYADLPSIGRVGGTTNYETYHPPSGYAMNSGVSRVAGQKRVLTLSIKSSVTSGHGSGNQYMKVDNNTAVSATTMLYDNGYNGFWLGCNYSANGSFKGRIYYTQLLPTQLTDAQVSTLHTNLRSIYGF
jgi:hypothetical protein